MLWAKLLGDNGIISFGKLRGGFATVGNDPGPYQTRDGFTATELLGGFNRKRED